ncbi:MAG: peptidylprolyl isomerase [Candidatus Pacebacteria bacterium]|nr:peptidylprolyl isomerase [Candidatus Paceibacterota bacterium]
MNKKTRQLGLLSVIIFSSLIFSACTSSQNDNQTIKSGSESILSRLETNPPESQATDSTQVEDKQKTMNEFKEIEDFKKIDSKTVTFSTTKGDIVIDLYTEEVPLTTANFLDLVDSGFYNDIIFHRVIPDFMAQVGDPLTKQPNAEQLWGTGGPGYKIKDEFNDSLKHDGPGILSMANSGPNTGGSQIFITHLATPWLDGKHAVFGKVSEGLDILMQIEKGDKIITATHQ